VRGKSLITIVACGMVAGVVWYLSSALLLDFFAQDFLDAALAGGPHPRWGGGVLFAVDIAMGVWVVWLYAAIKPRFGAKVTTAVIAGVAFWIIKTLQSAKFAGLGFVPAGVLLPPLVISLVAAVVAAIAGAWLFDRTDRRPAL
jgi:hypothetical protein